MLSNSRYFIKKVMISLVLTYSVLSGDTVKSDFTVCGMKIFQKDLPVVASHSWNMGFFSVRIENITSPIQLDKISETADLLFLFSNNPSLSAGECPLSITYNNFLLDLYISLSTRQCISTLLIILSWVIVWLYYLPFVWN